MEKNKILGNAFMWLFIGLLVCFGVSYLSTLNEEIPYLIYGSLGGYGYFIFFIVEIVVALFLTFKITTLKPIIAKILYLVYAALTGLSLTGMLFYFTASSIAFVFLATALLFGIFAVIGYTTKIDLSKWYTYLFMALLAIIILEIINMFLLNNTLNIILCMVSVLVFCAYIAYDIKKATDTIFLGECENKGIYIAFELFLDFINIFIDLLRLFGKSRD